MGAVAGCAVSKTYHLKTKLELFAPFVMTISAEAPTSQDVDNAAMWMNTFDGLDGVEENLTKDERVQYAALKDHYATLVRRHQEKQYELREERRRMAQWVWSLLTGAGGEDAEEEEKSEGSAAHEKVE